MARYRIRNWTKFQHYKDRNPPWIKLHVEILASEDWVMLDDASKLLALVCMVIAAKHDGFVPDNPAYIKRVAYLSKTPNLKPLIDCGFLEKAQADDSERKQEIAPARPEKEKETEQRQSRKKTSLRSVTRAPKKPASVEPEGFEAFWTEYPRKVAKPKARKAYIAALKKSSAAVLLKAATRYASERDGEDETYTAHASTWLNAERWNDPEKENHNGSGRGAHSERRTAQDKLTAGALDAIRRVGGRAEIDPGDEGEDLGNRPGERNSGVAVVDTPGRAAMHSGEADRVPSGPSCDASDAGAFGSRGEPKIPDFLRRPRPGSGTDHHGGVPLVPPRSEEQILPDARSDDRPLRAGHEGERFAT